MLPLDGIFNKSEFFFEDQIDFGYLHMNLIF